MLNCDKLSKSMAQRTLASVYDPNAHVLQGIKQIADYLGVSEPTAYRWLRDYGLPAMKRPSGHWFITKSLLDQWIVARAKIDRSVMGWAA